MQRIQLRSPQPLPTPSPPSLFERQGLGGFLSSIFDPDTTTRDTTTSPDTTSRDTTTSPTTTTPSTISTPTTSSTTTSSTTTSSTSSTSSTSLSVSIGSSTQADGSVVPVTITATTVVQETGRPSRDNSGSSSSSSNAGLIGGVVGGVGGAALLIVAALWIYFLVRRRKARTGSGWFLCFGTKPDNDGDIFDPSEGAHGRNGRANIGATLPQGFEDEDPENYNDMSEYPHSNSAGLGAAGGAAAYYGSGYEDQSQAPQSTSGGNLSSNHDYSHFDPPEVRAERAREAAEAAAAARSQSSHNTGNHPSALVPGTAPRRANSFGQSNDDHSFNGNGNGLASPPAYADAPEPTPNSREAAVLDDDDDDYYPRRPAALGIANPDDDAESSSQAQVPHNHLNKDLPPTSTSRRE